VPPKPPRRRRTQEERSHETKSKLLRATIDLLIERGYASLTVADISRRAGVSNGARVHHYRTKEDLVVAANAQAYDEAVATGTLRARDAAHVPRPIRELLADLNSLYFGRFFLGSLDSMIAARTDKRLARRIHPVVADYHTRIRKVWTDALREAGYSASAAQGIYDVALGIVRGMALKSTWRPEPKVTAAIVARVERLLHESVPRAR